MKYKPSPNISVNSDKSNIRVKNSFFLVPLKHVAHLAGKWEMFHKTTVSSSRLTPGKIFFQTYSPRSVGRNFSVHLFTTSLTLIFTHFYLPLLTADVTNKTSIVVKNFIDDGEGTTYPCPSPKKNKLRKSLKDVLINFLCLLKLCNFIVESCKN